MKKEIQISESDVASSSYQATQKSRLTNKSLKVQDDNIQMRKDIVITESENQTSQSSV